jgi:hypothetical protein
MWLRTALLLFLFLIVFRIVAGIVRRLSAPEPGGSSEPDASGERNRTKSPDWKPSDVIDVPFREVPRDAAAAEPEEESASSRGGRP